MEPPDADDPPPCTRSSRALEIRLFYVRISPCASEGAPPHLTLSHLRREMGVGLEINGSRVPPADPTALPLRRDRLEPAAATYVSTDGVRITGAVEFEVSDDKGNLVLCGAIERLEAPWSNGAIHHKDTKVGWSMDCYSAAGSAGGFLQPKVGIEVYVAGCFAGFPLILTQNLQLAPRRKVARPGNLDAIPEDEESSGRIGADEGFDRPSSDTEGEVEGYDPDMKLVGRSYYPEGWYVDDDGQLSWFNAGVRVGVGIGLGMCVGIGIGVGLLMRSYQATTRSFRRRFF